MRLGLEDDVIMNGDQSHTRLFRLSFVSSSTSPIYKWETEAQGYHMDHI